MRIKEERKSLNVKLETETKKCLGCGNTFDSEGMHNRICNICKKKYEGFA